MSSFFAKREETLYEKVKANTKKLENECLAAVEAKAKAAVPAINEQLEQHSKISRVPELKFTLDQVLSLTENDAFEKKDREYALSYLNAEYLKQGFKVVVAEDFNTFTLSW